MGSRGTRRKSAEQLFQKWNEDVTSIDRLPEVLRAKAYDRELGGRHHLPPGGTFGGGDHQSGRPELGKLFNTKTLKGVLFGGL